MLTTGGAGGYAKDWMSEFLTDMFHHKKKKSSLYKILLRESPVLIIISKVETFPPFYHSYFFFLRNLCFFTPLRKRTSLMCPLTELHLWTSLIQVCRWCYIACVQNQQGQGHCHPCTNCRGSSLPISEFALHPIGSRIELVIYCYGKFAYAKNYVKSKFGTRFYGPSSKPIKSGFKMENVIQTNYGSCNWALP